jgi:hypothetical protein
MAKVVATAPGHVAAACQFVILDGLEVTIVGS